MKHSLRDKLKQIRSNNTIKYRFQAEYRVKEAFLNFLKPLDIRSIAGYYPLNDEFNILSILSTAELIGITIALPFINNINNSMEFKQWSSRDKLRKNTHFYEPLPNSNTITPDLIIVPLLGFDRKGHRIGYGSGYYDRTLPLFIKSLKIALAYSNQEVDDIPVEKHDQKLDFIITEKEIVKIA